MSPLARARTSRGAAAAAPPRPRGAGRRSLVALLMGFALAPAPACGTTCAQIVAERDAFASRSTGADSPHAEVALPYALVDRLLSAHIRELPAVAVTPPGVSALLQRVVPPLTLSARELMLRPAPDGLIGFRLVAALRAGGAPLLDVHVDTRVRPWLDPQTGRLRCTLRGRDLRDVRLELGREAASRLAEAVLRLVPEPARGLLPRRELAAFAGSAVAFVSEQGHRLLRDTLYVRLGEIAHFEVALPGLPVARLGFRSAGRGGDGTLLVDVFTNLPVQRGLRASRVGRPALPERPERVRVRLAGSTVAALGNWTIARNPEWRRFNRRGEPRPDGEFEAALDWQAGARPLRVHLWRTAEPCLSVLLAGTPRIALVGPTLDLAFADGRIERVRGPALVEVGAWFAGLWGEALRYSQRVAGDLRFAAAGADYRASVAAVAVQDDELSLEFDLGRVVALTAPPR